MHHLLCKTPLNQGFRIQQLEPKHQTDKGQAKGIFAFLKVELPAGQGLVGYGTQDVGKGNAWLTRTGVGLDFFRTKVAVGRLG